MADRQDHEGDTMSASDLPEPYDLYGPTSTMAQPFYTADQLRAYGDKRAREAVHTGYIAPEGRYVPPVLFNPYTGEPRDARDIHSDPHGRLIVPPGAMLAAAPTPGDKT